MPKRTDIQSVLLIGAGPIIIGQACEFDYSGTQALKALKEEGYRVILVNSNPATIMTDPGFADRTYIEPITTDIVEKIIAKERPDVTAADTRRPDRAEPRHRSRRARHSRKIRRRDDRRQARSRSRRRKTASFSRKRCASIGLDLPRSGYARSMKDAARIQKRLDFPVIIRASRTLGGSGGNFAYNRDEFKEVVQAGFGDFAGHEVLIEESVLGWKEFEMEVMRDHEGQCRDHLLHRKLRSDGRAYRRFDHGGAGADADRQRISDHARRLACAVIREIGVETGGSNIQFARQSQDGRMIVIEMNPRVSRSSALA